MDDSLSLRVRAAAVAGWWTLLIGVGFVTLLWLVYLFMMWNRRAWMASMWGPDIKWSDIEYISLWAIVAFKFCLWMLTLIVIWLTLWARQLRKRTGA